MAVSLPVETLSTTCDLRLRSPCVDDSVSVLLKHKPQTRSGWFTSNVEKRYHSVVEGSAEGCLRSWVVSITTRVARSGLLSNDQGVVGGTSTIALLLKVDSARGSVPVTQAESCSGRFV